MFVSTFIGVNMDQTHSANPDHEGGGVSVSWKPFSLAKNSELIYDFIPLDINGLVEKTENKWTNAYYLSFCWEVDNNSPGIRSCGFVKLGLYYKIDSNNYSGNVDFWINDAISGCGLDPNIPGRTLAGFATTVRVCWKPVSIRIGQFYSLILRQNSSNLLTLIIKETMSPEETLIGSIEILNRFPAWQIKQLTTEIQYTGQKTSCMNVPIMNTLLIAPRDNQLNSSYFISHAGGNCISRSIDVMNEDKTAIMVYAGGEAMKKTEKNYDITAIVSKYYAFRTISTNTSQSSPSTTQIKPSLSLINITGNTLNLSVNVGSGSGKPDQIYLMAPQLSSLNGGKILGKMNGSKATWAIKLDKALSGKTIPLKIVGVKNGVESEAIQTNYVIPKNFVIINKPPVFPTPNTQTVICTRGQQSRAFVGKVCPPGWKG